MFVLVTVSGVKIYVYSMNQVLKKNVNDPLDAYANYDPTLPNEYVQSFCSQAAHKINHGILELRRLFLIDNLFDSLKFGLSLWFLTYIGSWFNAMTLTIMFWTSLFTIPKVIQKYSTNSQIK